MLKVQADPLLPRFLRFLESLWFPPKDPPSSLRCLINRGPGASSKERSLIRAISVNGESYRHVLDLFSVRADPLAPVDQRIRRYTSALRMRVGEDRSHNPRCSFRLKDDSSDIETQSRESS